MDKEHEKLVEYFYQKVQAKSKEIASKRMKEIEEEFTITTDGLEVEAQLAFWHEWKEKEVERARGEFPTIPISKLSKESFYQTHSKEADKKYLEEKMNLPDESKFSFIRERAYHYAMVSVIEQIKKKIEALSEGKMLLDYIEVILTF